jgi:hypothetical protein
MLIGTVPNLPQTSNARRENLGSGDLTGRVKSTNCQLNGLRFPGLWLRQCILESSDGGLELHVSGLLA